MAQIPRVTAKIFAGNAQKDDLGQFGSAVIGTKITNNDISILQALPAYEEGWRAAVISNRNYPTLQEMNSVQRIASQQIAYTLQNGMPEWDEGTTYYTSQFCRVGTSFYYSKIDENTGNNPVTSPDEWELWSGGGSGGSGSSRNIGELVQSLLPLDDVGLHLVDGSLIQGNGSYKAFVSYIATLVRTNENLACFTTEELWQESVTKYGVCGKFVYDSENNTVRLPKVTGLVEGTFDPAALGELVQAGLPALNLVTNTTGAHTHTRGTMNITGSFGFSVRDGGGTGAFSLTNSEKNINHGSEYFTKTVNFNASKAWTGETSSNGNHNHTVINNGSSIYGNADTVQPQTVQGYLYIVIANSTKTEVEVNIDNVMTDLNGKADVDLNNVTSISESSAVGQALANTLNTSNISNCITEVPKRVIYNRSGNNLTIDAGSVVIVPYGKESPTLSVGDLWPTNDFKVVDIQYNANGDGNLYYYLKFLQDVTLPAINATRECYVVLRIEDDNDGSPKGVITAYYINASSSGNSAALSNAKGLFYNSELNIIRFVQSGLYSLPMIIAQYDTNKNITGIQELNGYSWVGTQMWLDKGVKGLMPNGLNSDGSLNNIVYELENIITTSLASGDRIGFVTLSERTTKLTSNYLEGLDSAKPTTLANTYSYIYYATDTNRMYYSATSSTTANWVVEPCFKWGHYFATNTLASSVHMSEPFKAASAEDLDGKWVSKSLTLVNNATYPTSTDTVLNLSSYLPNDGNNYEIIVGGSVTPGTTTGNYVNLMIKTDIIPTSMSIISQRNPTNIQMWAGSTIIVPIGTARTLIVRQVSTYVGTYSLSLAGYRKVR